MKVIPNKVVKMSIIERVQSSPDTIQFASAFIAENRNPNLEKLCMSLAEGVNETSGAIVNLTILNPCIRLDGKTAEDIEIGPARFNGFIFYDNGELQVDFSLEPEGTPYPVGLSDFKVSELQKDNPHTLEL